MPKQIPTEGRIVHVHTPNIPHCQPAIVVRTWDAHPDALLNLQIFPDGQNDGQASGTEWATSVPHQEDPESRVFSRGWHWPEFVAPQED